MKRSLILAFIIILCSALPVYNSNTFSVGIPFLQHFKITDYKAAPQTWTIAQAPNGILYFGNNDGLLEYDGQRWHLYPLPSNSAIRSIYIHTDGKIFVGASDEFGYFETNEYGTLVYKGLSAEAQIDVQTVWKIIHYDNAIYFISGRKRIFKYDYRKITQLKIPPSYTEFRGFLCNQRFFLFDDWAGLAEIVNDTVYRYHTGLLPQKKSVYSILPYKNNQLLLGARRGGLSLFDLNKHSYLPAEESYSSSVDKTTTTININAYYPEFKTELNPFFIQNELYFGTQLSNGQYAFTTLKGGFITLSADGEVVDLFNKSHGLIDNACFSILEDKENNIWVTTEKGITLLEPNNGLRVFNSDNGLEGNIISVHPFKEKVFVGTSAGLFLIGNTQDKTFIEKHAVDLITNEHIYILDFLPLNTPKPSLLFSSLRNIHILDYNTLKINTLHPIYGCYEILPHPYLPNNYFLGNNVGIQWIKLEENNVKIEYTFSDITGDIRSLLFKDNRLYVSTAYSGLLVINTDNWLKPLNVNITRYTSETSGLKRNDQNYWAILGDSIIVLTPHGIYYPENQSLLGSENCKFVPWNYINNQLTPPETRVSRIVPLPEGDFWVGTDHGIAYFDKQNQRLIKNLYYRIKDSDVNDMALDSKNRLWISAYDNLYCFDPTQLDLNLSESPTLSIRSISIKGDSLLPLPILSHEGFYTIAPIDYKHNALKIEFFFPYYSNLKDVKFSYYLEGIDKTWSRWTTSGEYQINFIPQGEYVLRAKAITGMGIESPELHLKFSINPPWFLTTLAYIVYLLILAGLIYASVQIYSYRLKRDKERLENAIKLAVSTVEQQKEELSQQAAQLEITNQELNKLSLVARQTDNAVVIMDAKGNYEWINEGFTRMYGYTFDELKNETTRNKIGRNANLKINDLVNIWFGDKLPITYESLNRHKDGYELWVQTTLTPILDEYGNVSKLIAIDTDISKLKAAEFEIQRQRDEIQNQRDIALAQRDEILQQKIEITDSIRYAQRIQTVILNAGTNIKHIFPESFIINFPKDIVSGDFHWCHSEGGYRIIGVADCTGHGVPGAFMSLIGVNFLKEIVITHGFFMPNEILNLLRENIINALQQTGKDGENKDGLDIALITIDTKEKILYFSGANNPVWIINQQNITILEPDKMPISIYKNVHDPFKLHTYQLHSDDRIYMFSDGILDQFGGSEGKKLKTSNFRALLLRIQHLSMEQQKQYIENFKVEWQGEREQVDDIFILGFEVKSGINFKA